jgi:hypothetical protein
MAKQTLTLDTITLAIRNEMKPIQEFVNEQRVFNQKVGQTLYGINGEDDVVGELVKDQSTSTGRKSVFVAIGSSGLVLAVRQLIDMITKHQ